MEKINLADKLALFDDQWNPRIIGELNGQYVKVVKVEGEFVWHHHEAEDELFLVLDGSLDIEFRDGSVTLGPGEMVIVPAGTEHRPVALCEDLFWSTLGASNRIREPGIESGPRGDNCLIFVTGNRSGKRDGYRVRALSDFTKA